VKYRYRLIIENTTEDQEILEMSGHGISRTQQICLKSVRREINTTIREMLTDTKEELFPAAGGPRRG